MALGPQKYVTFIVTLTGSWQQLTLEASLTALPNRTNLIRHISIQQDPGNTHASYIAGVDIEGAAPTSTNYGVRLPAPVTSEPTAPYIIGDSMGAPGQLQLESIYVLGTAMEKLRICVVTYP